MNANQIVCVATESVERNSQEPCIYSILFLFSRNAFSVDFHRSKLGERQWYESIEPWCELVGNCNPTVWFMETVGR